MPVMEFRGDKYRLEDVSLTLEEARVVKRFTGLRVGAFQKAIEEMAAAEDVDGELMQAWLWVTLHQHGKTMDITDLGDVTLNEMTDSMTSILESAKQEETEAVPDPTEATAAEPVPVLPPPDPAD